MSVLRKFAGDTLIYGVSTIVARLLNFILTPLFVNRFPTAVYGVFTNLYSWAALINVFLAFGMETTFFRFLQKHEGDRARVYNQSFSVTLVTTGLMLLTVFLFLDPISRGLASWLGNGADSADFRFYVTLFALFLAADALAVVPFAKIRAEGKARRFAAIKITNISIFVVLNLVFIVAFPWMAEQASWQWMQFEKWYRPGWLGYVFIANLAASIGTLLLLAPELLAFKWHINERSLMRMLRYSFPILIANISFIINELIDKMVLIPWLVPKESAASDLGIYGAVSKLAILLSIAAQAFRFGAEPFFFNYSKNSNARQTYALIMDYFIILMVIGMVGVTANIEWIKYFIESGDPEEQLKFWSGLKVVPVLLMAYVMLGIYMNLSIWYKLSDQTVYALYIAGIGALVTVVLNVLLIPHFSYVGAAWVTLIAYASMVVLSYFWGQKNFAIPYNTRKNLAYLGAGALISWLSFDVFQRNVLVGNALLLLFVGTCLYLEQNNLKRYFLRKN